MGASSSPGDRRGSFVALLARRLLSEAQAISLIAAVAGRGVLAGRLTLGSDNGTAYASRSFRARRAEPGITHRRGGYRDPEFQAFIESCFSKLKQRCV